MHTKPEVKIVEAFQISNLGMIAFIKNENENFWIKKGTIIKSPKSNKSWIVKSRIIEFPEIETQYGNETITNSFLHFSNIENKLKAESKAKARIENNIYQYIIEPILHIDKPLENEIIEITEHNDKFINPKIFKILIRELKFHSNNGEENINSIGFILFEVSKMTNSKSSEVLQHLVYMIGKDFIKIISEDPIAYKLTEKGKGIV